MKRVPDSELISAYLDGELTANEQALVEKLLAASPDARQLMEELRTLSGTLQNLPQYELGEDLSEQVLRRAERQILTAPGSHGTAAPPQPSLRRRLLNPRALVWSGLAVAVALWMMVMETGQFGTPSGDEVAESVPTLPPASESELAPTFGARHDDDVEAEEVGVEEGRGLGVDARRRSAPHSVVMKGGADAGGAVLRDTDQPTAATGLSEKRLEEVPGKAAGRAIYRKGGVREQVAEDPARQQPASPAPSVDAPAETPIDENRIQVRSRDEAPEEADRSLAGRGFQSIDATPPMNGTVQPGSDRGSGAVARPSGLVRRGRLSEPYERFAARAGEVALVYCDITQKAVETQAVDNVLLANGIAVEEEAKSAAQTGAAARGREYQARGQGAGKESPDFAGYRMGEPAGMRNVDVLLVEATQAQIEATLAGLAAQPNDFPSVVVHPAPRITGQQAWSQFNRRQVGLPASRDVAEELGRQAGDAAVAKDERQQDMKAKGTARATDGQREPFGQAWRFQIPETDAQRRFATQTEDLGGVSSQEALPKGFGAFGGGHKLSESDHAMGEPADTAANQPRGSSVHFGEQAPTLRMGTELGGAAPRNAKPQGPPAPVSQPQGPRPAAEPSANSLALDKARENPVRNALSQGLQRLRAPGQAAPAAQQPSGEKARSDIELGDSEPKKEPARSKLGSGVAGHPRPGVPAEQGQAKQEAEPLQRQVASYQVLFVFRVVAPEARHAAEASPGVEAEATPEKKQ